MARIVIIRHASEPRDRSRHAIFGLGDLWRDAGHDVEIVYGPDSIPDADLAILHVDLTIVPPAYREAVARLPRVINGGAFDISKRNVSRNLLKPGDPWPGKVIVKSDLNCWGWPEWRAHKAGAHPPVPYPVGPRVVAGLADVPDEIWSGGHFVVEPWLGELVEGRFAIRHWIFLGQRERCKRVFSPDPIIKGENIVGAEDVPVPDEIRAERRRLGLDFGKLDFVVKKGIPVLFDANKTPGPLPDSAEGGLPEYLAAGLDELLREPATSA